jgi:two-component system, LytTR family, response regulator
MADIRVLLVDDEPLARARLRRLLSQIGGTVVVGECDDGYQLAPAIKAYRPDLLLLDITMPGFSGFETLEQLNLEQPLVVFVTAHAEYAVQAYSVDAVDYLLKPVSAARLGVAMGKVRRALKNASNSILQSEHRISVVGKGRTTIIDVRNIEAIQAKSNYLTIFEDARQTELRSTLAKLEAQLDSKIFIKVHRSILVRRSAVREVRSVQSGRYQLTLQSGRSVPTGRSYSNIVQRVFLIKARVSG